MMAGVLFVTKKVSFPESLTMTFKDIKWCYEWAQHEKKVQDDDIEE